MIAGRGAAYALLGLAALLLVAAVSSGWSGASRLAGREDDATAVESAAAAFVAAYGTFDAAYPHGYTVRLAELTSGELRDAIARASVDRTALTRRRLSAVTVDSVSVTSLSGDSATATVHSTHERRWAEPASGRVVRERVTQRVSLRLVREGARWLVAELRVLGEESSFSEG